MTGGAAPRPVPRSRKGEATRARVLEAAKRVFVRDGFHAARVSDIAHEAGMAVGSLYHYFDSKEAIIRELARAQEERLIAPAEEEDEVQPVDGRDAIRLSTEQYLRRYREEAALWGVIEQVSRSDPEVGAVRMATIKALVDGVEREIRRVQLEGVADPTLNPGLAADALAAMASRFAELWLVQGYRDYDFDEVVEQLTKLMSNALGLPR